MAQRLKRLPSRQETRVQSLGQEDPLNKEMATPSSILTWRFPWAEEPGRLHSMGSLSRACPSDFTFTFHFPASEKEMETYSSVLAWEIPWTEELDGLQSMGSQRVRHDLGTKHATDLLLYSFSFRCDDYFKIE